MRAEEILQRRFEHELGSIHLSRVRLVFAAVYTLLRSGKLSLTSLGRAIAGATTHRHGIKRIDRLLGNRHIHRERVDFYRALARGLVQPGSRPLVIVDWTAVTTQLWALVAAVPYQGRALIIYAETHGINSYMKPYVNKTFLDNVKAVLPVCMPIIVTDAGFRTPWMKLVLSYGWDYISRVRGLNLIRSARDEAWCDIERLWKMTGATASELGSYEIGRKTHFRTRVVGIRKKPKYQRRPAKRDFGPKRQKRAAREPWILATSLSARPAKVVAMYSLRMQIEETFRDAKSHRFGISLSYARTQSSSRADVLLLLAAFAHVLYVLLGLAAEAADLQRRYQANTIRRRRVLSLAMLGRLVLADHAPDLLEGALAEEPWDSLRERIAAAQVC
ncbi:MULTISPECIES: IS4 family transposase [unclassified Anaeromyxobacter]|uniref:IS4 family transposase n=1 Tax=unclassified Anaeromyxobacter TaxID=2620896 RepID=UPI001F5A8461|nr:MULTISPECIES: IS4 family transposase [unclassified Anaeromyxobacter]